MTTAMVRPTWGPASRPGPLFIFLAWDTAYSGLDMGVCSMCMYIPPPGARSFGHNNLDKVNVVPSPIRELPELALCWGDV